MKSRLMTVVIAAVGLVTMGANDSIAFGGGARIVIRQNSHHGFGGGGVVANWLMREADTVIQNQFGGNSASGGLSPAVTLPTQNTEIKRHLDRLDRLNGVTTNPPTNPGQQGGPILPVPAGAGFPANYPQ